MSAYTTNAERLALEPASAFVTQRRQRAPTAPDGTVLDAGAPAALRDGRALLCNTRAAPRPERATAAAAAARDVQSDAGKVNPDTGGRDVTVAVFAGRAWAAPGSGAGGDQRALPAPAVRAVGAASEEAAAVGGHGRAEAARRGLANPAGLTVRGDGAAGIWHGAGAQFPGADAGLDRDHGAEPRAAAAQRLFGEGTAAARAHTERGRQRLLGGDGVGRRGGRGAAGRRGWGVVGQRAERLRGPSGPSGRCVAPASGSGDRERAGRGFAPAVADPAAEADGGPLEGGGGGPLGGVLRLGGAPHGGE